MPILRRSDDREADRRKGRGAGAPRPGRRERRPRSRAHAGAPAGPRDRPGRRGPGERGLCPLEEQGDGRGRHGELRAQPARHDQRGRAARSWSIELNADPAVDGILVQLPLPPQIDATRVIETHRPGQGRRRLPPDQRRPAGDRPRRLRAVHAARLPHLLKQELGDLAGLEAVVIGRSNIVGKPMALLLLARELHRHHRPFAHARPARRRPPRRHRRRRGRPAGNGQRRLDQARRDGDRRRHQPDRRPTTARAAWSATSPSPKPLEVAGAITPVPGGVGPMTIAMLMRNTLVAAHRRAGLADRRDYDRRLLLAAAPVPTAVDAERAFAARRAEIGQWTAFRKYADRDAVMFTPQAVWAQRVPRRTARTRPRRSRWCAGAQLRLVRRADRGQHRPVVRPPTASRTAISPPSGSATERELALGL